MKLQRGYVASADGTQIRYEAIGSGRPILCCNGLGVPIYFWRYLSEAFCREYQVICWDYRGHGKSDDPPDLRVLHFDDLVADGVAVVNHLDLHHAVGLGHSAGFQVLLGLYEQYPDRFDALSSFTGSHGQVLSCFYDTPVSRLAFDFLYVMSVYHPDLVRNVMQIVGRTPIAFYLGGMLGILDLSEARRHDIQIYLDHVCAMDPRFFATLTQGAEAHCARHVLSTVQCPTLVIASEHDKFVPLRVAEEMMQQLAHGELHVIPDGTHGAFMETPQIFNQRLAQFLWKHRLTPQTSTGRRRSRRPRSGQG